MSPKKFPWSRYPLAWYYAKLYILLREDRWITFNTIKISFWLRETYGIAPLTAVRMAHILYKWMIKGYTPQALVQVGPYYYTYCYHIESHRNLEGFE